MLNNEKPFTTMMIYHNIRYLAVVKGFFAIVGEPKNHYLKVTIAY